MKNLLQQITKIFKTNGYENLINATNDIKLTYLYALYHYYYGDEDYLLDIIDRTDFKNTLDNPANGFFDEESFDEKILDILCPYYIEEGETFSVDKLNYKISQIISIVSSIKNRRFNLIVNDSKIKEYWDPEDKETKIVVKILTNAKPDFDERKNISARYSSNFMGDLIKTFEFIYGDDIEEEISQLTSDKKSVDVSEFTLENPNAFLKYGEEESIITNIMASSIKENFQKFGKAGLFAMNLRFYVPNKKVDEGLENTIKNHGDRFWYYNNGIIIICDDYKIIENRLKLTNFSIVNGGQTTRMIGVIPFEKDFAVSCKVIKAKYKNGTEEASEFVSSVAEASNTQKPINSTDLIANRFEQRYLKTTLSENGIFLQIKRGDAASANLQENYPEPWQRVKNDELGQLLFSTIYQKPGTSRSAKDKIFSDKRKYQLVFGKPKKYNPELLKDLIFIKSLYKKWQTSISKSTEADANKKGLVKNGYLFFAATIGLMAKFAFNNNLVKKLNEISLNTELGNHLVCSHIFNHRIFNDNYTELQSRMYDLFNLIYDKYIYRAYSTLKEIKPELIYSNFCKTDKNQNQIMQLVFDDFAAEIPSRVIKVLNPIFYTPNEVDKQNNFDLLEEAISTYETQPVEVEDVDILFEDLRDRLKEYRTNKYKELDIQAYKIFSNKELNNLATYRPKTLKEMASFGCFESKPNTKIRTYGNDILAIIKQVCGY